MAQDTLAKTQKHKKTLRRIRHYDEECITQRAPGKNQYQF